MLQFSNLTIGRAVANQSEAMEADTISKNGRSLKSHTSRRNFLTIMLGIFFTIAIFFVPVTSAFAQDKIYYFQSIPTEESNEIKECPQNLIDNYDSPGKWYSFSNATEGKLVFYRRENANALYKTVEGQIINGKKEGDWKFTITICSPCTDMTLVCKYVNNIKNGKYSRYREKFLYEEGIYVNDKLDGKITSYIEPMLQGSTYGYGFAYSESFYANGIIQKSIKYDSNGKKIKEDFYDNGKQRTWIEYNKDGSIKNKGVY